MGTNTTFHQFPRTNRRAVEVAIYEMYAKHGMRRPDVVFFNNYHDMFIASFVLDYFRKRISYPFIQDLMYVKVDQKHQPEGYVSRAAHISLRNDPVNISSQSFALVRRNLQRYVRKSLHIPNMYSSLENLQPSRVLHGASLRAASGHPTMLNMGFAKYLKILCDMTFDVIFFGDVALVCENPVGAYVDDQFRLHENNALEFGQSFSTGKFVRSAFWKGVYIPKMISDIRPTLIDFLDGTSFGALNPQNINSALEYSGGLIDVLRRTSQSGVDIRRGLTIRVCSEEADPEHGRLVSFSYFRPRVRMKFLLAECPRNGTICERVPEDTMSVKEAQAWRVGLPVSEFEYPQKRT